MPCLEQLLDVLPAFRVPRRRIAIDRDSNAPARRRRESRAGAQAGIEIEFAADHAAIAHRQRRQLLQAFEQPLGLDASVRLDVTDDDSTPVARTRRAASSIE